jgi:hypothetical protein
MVRSGLKEKRRNVYLLVNVTSINYVGKYENMKDHYFEVSHASPTCPSGKSICLFVFGATAPSGPGPPHSRGF